MLELNTDITKINRVGVQTAKRLKKLGVETVEDLLYYFPFRYDDFSKITPIDNLKAGESANVVGQIELIQSKRSHRKRMSIVEALVSDDTESIKVIWFNQPFIAKNLRVGDKVSLAGKVEDDYGSFIMKSPIYEKIPQTHLNPPSPPLIKRGNIKNPPFIKGGGGGFAVHTQGFVPNYHLTANITQKQVRFLIKQVVGLAKEVKDWLPNEIEKNLKLLNLGDAISKIHFPKNKQDIDNARRRLAFNELFLIQAQSQLIRRDTLQCVAEKIKFLKKETKKFVDSLPFKLTDAQRKAAWEILQDIESPHPMSRLLEGDVGSGKTVVALMAILNTVLNKKQAVLMVPTEILAKQHYDSVINFFADFDIKVGLMTRSTRQGTWNKEHGTKSNGLSKKKMTKAIKGGEVDVIIGTHALIQETIEFKNLSLVIIDEQHRFGVEQRKMIIEKSGPHPDPLLSKEREKMPHLLSMTATPIPRSLALALYGDLDISVIDEMPIGRKKILTKVVPEIKRKKVYDFIREKIKEGRQVFVICPLIDMSDKLGVKSVKEEFEKLDKKVFKDLNIGMLHGRMPARGWSASGGKATSKEQVMRDFLDNKIKILVSTSVVEVGVDVPNAAIMMIEGADRFGLAQLHQFRGRVGRSDHQSYCFLFTESDSPKTLKRLQALVDNNDGFALAKMDLKFRGPGEVYGTMQKGFPELKMASLFDYELMKLAKSEAEKLIKKDENLSNYLELKEKLGEWEKKVHLE